VCPAEPTRAIVTSIRERLGSSASTDAPARPETCMRITASFVPYSALLAAQVTAELVRPFPRTCPAERTLRCERTWHRTGRCKRPGSRALGTPHSPRTDSAQTGRPRLSGAQGGGKRAPVSAEAARHGMDQRLPLRAHASKVYSELRVAPGPAPGSCRWPWAGLPLVVLLNYLPVHLQPPDNRHGERAYNSHQPHARERSFANVTVRGCAEAWLALAPAAWPAPCDICASSGNTFFVAYTEQVLP
jgi:hypothetical protein